MYSVITYSVITYSIVNYSVISNYLFGNCLRNNFLSNHLLGNYLLSNHLLDNYLLSNHLLGNYLLGGEIKRRTNEGTVDRFIVMYVQHIKIINFFSTVNTKCLCWGLVPFHHCLMEIDARFKGRLLACYSIQ